MTKKIKSTHCNNCPSFEDGVFCELKEVALNELSSQKISNQYKKGQTLFMEGSPPFGIFCISSGNVKLVKSDSNGKESLVRIVSKGDILGHRSIFSDQPYQATAVALEDTSVCFLDKKYIYDLVQNEPSVAFNLISRLSQSLGLSEDRLASLSQKTVRERVAEFLLLLCSTHGKEEKEGIFLDIKLTREDMASSVGTATETLIRFISEFKQEKIINTIGKKIYVTDKEKLSKFANIES